jgi:NADH:ubiquinone oxidoreductase subunit E
VGLVCLLHGAGTAGDRVQESPELLGADRETPVRRVPCLGYCFAAPVAVDSGGRLCRLTIEDP